MYLLVLLFQLYYVFWLSLFYCKSDLKFLSQFKVLKFILTEYLRASSTSIYITITQFFVFYIYLIIQDSFILDGCKRVPLIPNMENMNGCFQINATSLRQEPEKDFSSRFIIYFFRPVFILKMAAGWLPIFMFTLIWALVGGLAPRYVPNGPYKQLIQVSIYLHIHKLK